MYKNQEQMGLLEAQSVGMSPTDVAEIVAKYGPQVMSVVNSALKNGFSFPFVIECLKLFGPVVLDFIVSLFKEKQEVKAQGLTDENPFSSIGNIIKTDPEISEVLGRENIEGLTPQVISSIFEKILPLLIKKYGPALLEAVLKAIEDWASKEEKTPE
jgi:hypothetical protein